MTRRAWCGLACGAVATAAWKFPRTAVTAASDPPQTSKRLGLSLAGAEFGHEQPGFSNQQPGQSGLDYTWPTPATIHYFASQGFGLFRLPFRWERIQPELNGELNRNELAALRATVDAIADVGGHALLDLHNYARYSLHTPAGPREYLIDQSVNGKTPVTRAHLADVWRKLATVFADQPAVIGYGIMNEPHDMGRSRWKAISQAAVTAIREVDRETHVVIAGDAWSGSDRWEQINGRNAWIHDPAQRCVYEAHCYFDANASGKYVLSYEEELRRDPALIQRGVHRLRSFMEWCRRNQVPGLLGEFGVPADAGWLKVMQPFLAAIGEAKFPCCYWAAGEWWGDYPLSIQPGAHGQPAPQLAILKDYSS